MDRLDSLSVETLTSLGYAMCEGYTAGETVSNAKLYLQRAGTTKLIAYNSQIFQ